jgi:hypothetical protein
MVILLPYLGGGAIWNGGIENMECGGVQKSVRLLRVVEDILGL